MKWRWRRDAWWNSLGWETYGSGKFWKLLKILICYPKFPIITGKKSGFPKSFSFQKFLFPLPFQKWISKEVPTVRSRYRTAYVSHPKELNKMLNPINKLTRRWMNKRLTRRWMNKRKPMKMIQYLGLYFGDTPLFFWDTPLFFRGNNFTLFYIGSKGVYFLWVVFSNGWSKEGGIP